MSEQNSSAFFMHNFALRSSLAAKSEIVKTLRGEIRDFFGKINEYKSNFSETVIRKLIRHTYRFKKNNSGTELAEKIWPALKFFLESEIDFDQEYSEFEKKAFLIVILERTNKFFNFEFLPRDTSFQIFIFHSIILPYISSLIKEFFNEDLDSLQEINSFMVTKLNYSINTSLFGHMNPETDKGYLQDIIEMLNEIKLFIPIKKVKVLDETYKSLSMLFDKDYKDLRAKLENYLYRSNDFSLLTNSSNISGTPVINASFYSYIEKNSYSDSHNTFRVLIQTFESALFLIDELNQEIDKVNEQIIDVKYGLKDKVQNLRSEDLYSMFFNPSDFISQILLSTVSEFSEDSGVNIEIVKSSLEESRLQTRDFFTSVNSILICSCSYFDNEQLKQTFYNRVCDYIRLNFVELDSISPKERELVALAALSYSSEGIDFLLSLFGDDDSKNNFLSELDLETLFQNSSNDKTQSNSDQKSVDFLKHNLQFNLWKAAKSILAKVFETKNNAANLAHHEIFSVR